MANFDNIIKAIWVMSPSEKKQLIANLEGKITPALLDEVKTICVLADKKVREAMFNEIWTEAHQTA